MNNLFVRPRQVIVHLVVDLEAEYVIDHTGCLTSTFVKKRKPNGQPFGLCGLVLFVL